MQNRKAYYRKYNAKHRAERNAYRAAHQADIARYKISRNTPERYSYQGMLNRCTNPHAWDYTYYGGRGIRVCERWLGKLGFQHFQEDMGKRPKGRTLDRRNNDRNYSPQNCRWATRIQQRHNQRRTQ